MTNTSIATYTAIIAAAISFLGVLISTLVASITAKSKSKQEISLYNSSIENKLKDNIFNYVRSYSDNIAKKRIEVYPEIYSIVSMLAKHIKENTITTEIIKDALLHVNQWDSNNAIFLGSISTGHMDEFRRLLTEISINDLDINKNKLRHSLMKKIIRLELSLKQDLYIYNIEALFPQKKIDDYGELNYLITQTHKEISDSIKI